MLASASFSEAGRKGENEDSVLLEVDDSGRVILAVADGMGGHSGGQVASRTVIDVVRRSFAAGDFSFAELFARAYRELEMVGQREQQIADLGTTLTVCTVDGVKASVGHVGDCRLYHLRGHGIITRTSDQTELQHLLDEGVISRAQGRHYPRASALLSVLSPKVDYRLDRTAFDLHPGDRLMLCSDGVYRELSKSEIRDISVKHSSPAEFASELKRTLDRLFPKDDYSAVIADLPATVGRAD